MKIGEVLVYLNDGPGSMNRLARAGALASAHHARLVALFGREPTTASALPASGEPGYLDPEEIERMDRRIEERTRAIAAPLKDRFDEILKHDCLAGEWRTEEGNVANVIRNAMYSDVTLLGRHDETSSPTAVRPDEVALQSGRPVIVLPASSTHAWPPRRFLCAWNGRREAMRAIVDALPLLLKAEEVIVITVTHAQEDHAQERPGAEIARYLERRGIRVQLQNAHGANGDAFRLIVEQAYAMEADMLVMGAYGHSRLRESLLGGATREALDGVPLPLSISH